MMVWVEVLLFIYEIELLSVHFENVNTSLGPNRLLKWVGG